MDRWIEGRWGSTSTEHQAAAKGLAFLGKEPGKIYKKKNNTEIEEDSKKLFTTLEKKTIQGAENISRKHKSQGLKWPGWFSEWAGWVTVSLLTQGSSLQSILGHDSAVHWFAV